MSLSKFVCIVMLVVLAGGYGAGQSEPTAFPADVEWSSGSDWGSGGDASPAFSPDGNTVYFCHRSGEKRWIFVSHLRQGKWSKPEVATFSGEWNDIEPAMAPDGSYLIFSSNRPANEGGKALDGHYGGETSAGGGGNFWRVDRKGDDWSKPVRLPDVINSNTSIFAPAVVRDGSLYFMQPDPATNKFRLYRSQFSQGSFAAPQPLPFSDGVTQDFDPVVAPDESFMVFSSARKPTPEKRSGIFIAFQRDHRWGAPVASNPMLVGIESRLSPDLKTLYFTTRQPKAENITSNSTSTAPVMIWQVSLSTVAEVAQTATLQMGAARIFAPGTISGPGNDGAPTFTPDGKTLYFTRGGARWVAIVESQQVGGEWAEPKVASFSGVWSDQQPALSRDGKRLVFESRRPLTPGDANTKTAGLWQVDRKQTGWGEPVLLPPAVNVSTRVFKPSLAANGDLYFMEKPEGKQFRLLRSRYVDGHYEQAEPLPFSDGSTNDVDPEIAPDESFLIFSSDGRRAGDTAHEHLYVVFKTKDVWGPVTALRFDEDEANGPSSDNEAHLSPDLKTLYFSSDRTLKLGAPRSVGETEEALKRLSWDNGNTNVWMVSTAALFSR